MRRLIVFALAAATLAGAAIVLATMSTLPDPVATHFGSGGRANGWMTRDGYRLFMVGFVVAVPWFVYGVTRLAAGCPKRMFSMRNADYWLAPERRDATIATLKSFGALTAVLITVFLTAAHLAVVEANQQRPPRLDENAFITGLVVFVVAIVAIAIAHGLSFRMPRDARRR